MKLLRTFSGQEFILQDDEAYNIVQIKNSPNSKAFLELRCGAFVDTSAIESISGIPLIAMAEGRYKVSKDGRSYMREGDRVYIEHPENIKWLPDPKYQELEKATFEITESKKIEPQKVTGRDKGIQVNGFRKIGQ